jgi:VIT1/CCC1 family predicted Fe2+/Mn2+ transporter
MLLQGKFDMKHIPFFQGSILLILLFVLASAWTVSGAPTREQIEQQRSDIRKMANDTLERLYATQPSAKKAIKNAAGYAVLSNFGSFFVSRFIPRGSTI